MLEWILLLVVLVLAWRMRPKPSGYALPKKKCACGNCAGCKTCGKASTPLNAPSRKVELTDSAGDALVSGFGDRGDMYDSSAYLNQPPWETLQKNSPSLYELERHRITTKNPEKGVMDKIYAMNEDEMFEDTLRGLSHSINSDPLVIKSDETRDQMLFRSLTSGNTDGALNEGVGGPPIDQFERDALIRQSRGTGGQRAPTGYI